MRHDVQGDGKLLVLLLVISVGGQIHWSRGLEVATFQDFGILNRPESCDTEVTIVRGREKFEFRCNRCKKRVWTNSYKQLSTETLQKTYFGQGIKYVHQLIYYSK